jgi:hypothetical protein
MFVCTWLTLALIKLEFLKWLGFQQDTGYEKQMIGMPMMFFGGFYVATLFSHVLKCRRIQVVSRKNDSVVLEGVGSDFAKAVEESNRVVITSPDREGGED